MSPLPDPPVPGSDAGTSSPLRFVFVTGLSGAGKSTAARAFEDLQFWCVDNLPGPLLEKLLRLSAVSGDALGKLAVVCDVRDAAIDAAFPTVFAAALAQGRQVDLLFLEASEEILVRRFERTGRRHPLARPGTASAGPSGASAGDVRAALAEERARLAPLRARATEVVDTSQMTVHELRRHVVRRFSGGGEQRLEVGLVSYGLSGGLPPEVDVAIDARFLPKAIDTGAGAAAGARSGRCLDRVTELLAFLFPLYQREGKAYLTIGVGDDEGDRGARSATLAQVLKERLEPLGISTRERPHGG